MIISACDNPGTPVLIVPARVFAKANLCVMASSYHEELIVSRVDGSVKVAETIEP